MRVEDMDEAAAIVNRALDLGISYIDSARGYQDSEAKMGQVVKERRDEVFLATKTHAKNRDEALEHLETSLSELQADHLDLWQMDDVSTRERMEHVLGKGGVLEAARRAQDEGLVRFVGITGHAVDILCELIDSGEFDTVLCVYNLAISNTRDTVMRAAQQADMGVVVMKPLSGGTFFRRKETMIPPERAWHFVLQNELVDVALAGAQSIRDVEQAVGAADSFTPLSPEEQHRLIEQARYLGEQTCGNCEYCKDCPAGINIPQLMQIYDEAQVFSYEWPRFRRIYAQAAVKADACEDCGQCEEACPMNLPIRERLAWVHKRFYQPI